MSVLAQSIESVLQRLGRRSNLKGEFGVEIEIEGRNLPILDGNKIWDLHADHSLRGESAEYVFRIPLNKKEANTALHYLASELKNSTIHNSNRTSVHVHRNVIPWLVQEVYTAITLYYMFETMLVRFSGADRQGNMYCLRSCDAEYLVLMVKRSISDESYLLGNLLNDNIRYSSLNLKALLSFGSLEFRSFRGSVNPKEIILWMEIISALCSSSQKFNNPRDVIEMYTSVSLLDFIRFTFNEVTEFIEFLLAQPDLGECFQQGYSYAFEIAHAPKAKSPWINVNEAKKQPAIKSSKIKNTIVGNDGAMERAWNPEFENLVFGNVQVGPVPPIPRRPQPMQLRPDDDMEGNL